MVSVEPLMIPEIAMRNFEVAARLVVKEAKTLPLSLATTRKINRILTRGLIPERHAGNPRYYERNTGPFYRWLESKGAQRLGQKDPVQLASKIHDGIQRLDGFADGNGRTSRLMADLALLKYGHGPASYT